MYQYNIQGLALRSDFRFAGVEACDGTDNANVVVIEEQPVPSSLLWPEKTRRFYQITPSQTLLKTREAGKILVTGGRRIAYECNGASSHHMLGSHMLGSGLAAIHHQRGNVVLHGASVCRGNRAYLICGKSGAGKSTIVAHLLANSGQTLGDDVAAVGSGPDFFVHASPSVTKLTDDALADIPEYLQLLTEDRCVTGKRIISTRHRFADRSQPLGGIVILETGEVPQVRVERVPEHDAVATLQNHTFRKRFITKDKIPVLQEKWAALAQSIAVWRVIRPTTARTVDQVTAKVEELITMMIQASEGRAE